MDNCECDYGTFTDPRDDKTYKYVKICNQTWMAENLAYYDPSIGFTCGKHTCNHSSTEKRYYIIGLLQMYSDILDYNPASNENFHEFGVLYNLPAALEACPEGWHLPSESEWTQLFECLGTIGLDNISTKLRSTYGWFQDGNGTNESGFNAKPGGTVMTGVYQDSTKGAYFWYDRDISTTGSSLPGYRLRYNDDENSELRSLARPGEEGFSIRCIKD